MHTSTKGYTEMMKSESYFLTACVLMASATMLTRMMLNMHTLAYGMASSKLKWKSRMLSGSTSGTRLTLNAALHRITLNSRNNRHYS